MEFWKYLTEGKGLLLPEELELPVEDMEKSEKKVSGKVPQPLYDTSNFPFVSSSQGSLGGQELVELGFGDNTLGRLGQSYHGAPSRDTLSNDQIGQKKHVDFGVSSSAVESDCLEFATIDFKLGVLADCSSMSAGDGESSKDGAVFRPNMPAKRAQLMSSDSQICQVYGCSKDLSSSKGYYKRHKVCEDHTKTAVVIVKGIEQRFCQQCSRFHLLAEFDEGKRSCRKRLAHHNERRRKPRGAGTRFLGSSSTTRTSFLFQETLATAFSGPSKHESEIWSGHVKFEDPKLDSTSLLNFHDSIEETVGTNTNVSCIPDPSDALSLLSSQSQIIGPSGFHLSAKEGPSTTVASNGVSDDGVFNRLNTSDSNHFLSSGQGTMVDLSQLSSHLQMVEHKRKLMR